MAVVGGGQAPLAFRLYIASETAQDLERASLKEAGRPLSQSLTDFL
jgi:hypothetical protein